MRRLAALPAMIAFSACAALKPGFTKEGAAVAVAAPDLGAARREAVRGSLDLFLSPSSPERAKTADAYAARAEEFTGSAKFKNGKGVVELRYARIMAALQKDGLLRPAGFTAHEPWVLLLISEPDGILDLGVGPAADAMRRAFSAHGMTAIDGRDSLNEFKAQGKDPAALAAAGAKRFGAEWMLVAAASASAGYDKSSGVWPARAGLVADLYKVGQSTPVAQVQTEGAAVDVSSESARGKALESAGEQLVEKVAEEIVLARAGRSEGAVYIEGASGPDAVKGALASVRGVPGVAGAYLGVWRDDDGATIIRVFLKGIKIDGLAANLLRRDSTLTLVSVEPDAGRLAVELPSKEDE